MPKLTFNRGRNAEEKKSIEELTQRIKGELKEKYGDFVRPTNVADYLGVCYKTAHRILRGQYKGNLPPVRQACGTKKYHSIDVARRLAELEIISSRA